MKYTIKYMISSENIITLYNRDNFLLSQINNLSVFSTWKFRPFLQSHHISKIDCSRTSGFPQNL